MTATFSDAVRPLDPTLDLIGVGFGPSNLALAIALREAGGGLSCRFLERRDRFVWHGDMLLDDSRMQISFLKDLVSLRNPTSPFSFINYLHERGRLQDFINLRTFYPSRREFNDYLAWAAARFHDQCGYGEAVTAIEPEVTDGRVNRVRVHSRDGSGRERQWLTRNVVIGVGGQPCLPETFASLRHAPNVIHSHNYLAVADRLAKAERVAVVGFGQSAAEIFLDLHSRGAAVDVIARAPAMRPADSSPFVNQIFDADYTDYFHGRPDDERRRLVGTFSSTNYAVVDPDLIDAIFNVFYQQKVENNPRHGLIPRHEVRAAGLATVDSGDGAPDVVLDLANLDDGSRRTRRYGGVVLATGYRHATPTGLLEPLLPWLTDTAPARDYRLPTVAGCTAGIYIQGCCEATHGLSDSLLSVLPVRADEIAESLFSLMGLASRPASRAVG